MQGQGKMESSHGSKNDEKNMTVQEIIQKRKQETMKQQGLQLVQTLRVS